MVFGFGLNDPSDDGALKGSPDKLPDPDRDITASDNAGEMIAVLGGGCFWCVDAVYRLLDGVSEVVSGYAGGTEETANYRAVCRGDTGHAEVVKVRFDPSRITYGQILKIFFSVAHDPTQLNRQGNDVGPQYRSVIFYADEAQREVAESYIRQLDGAGLYVAPIVTEVAPLEAFYTAEPYHQDYANRNPSQPYIACISLPKVQKLRKYFPDMLNPPSKL
jgi:peptide-methionine (S)-S-oxide reductase